MLVGEARVPEGLRVYAVGDVHGRRDCLEEMLDLIETDLRDDPPEAHRIVMLGDYCDRGPDSRGVIDMLVERAAAPEFVCLLGNHDQWLRSFLLAPDEVGESFLYWGGISTLASYRVTAGRWGSTPAELSRRLQAEMPLSHRDFLNRLPAFQIEGDYFFCHAGVDPDVDLLSQSTDDLVWIRQKFLLHRGDFGKVVVHGHTPVLDVDIRPNRINVDTLAYDTGLLSALVLQDDRQRVIQTRQPPASDH